MPPNGEVAGDKGGKRRHSNVNPKNYTFELWEMGRGEVNTYGVELSCQRVWEKQENKRLHS